MSRANVKTDRKASTSILVIGFALLIGWSAILCMASSDGKLEVMSQLGNAYAPATAFFAWLAAFGALRSYEAQRQQLEDERARARTQRFDELFFCLMDHYDQKINSSVRESMAVTHQVRRSLRDQLGSLMSILLNPSPAESRSLRNRWAEMLDPVTGFLDLAALDTQICASLRLLRAFSDSHVNTHGDLLVGRLTRHELKFWQYSVAMTADRELIEFAERMRFYGADKGMTVADAIEFATAEPKGANKLTE